MLANVIVLVAAAIALSFLFSKKLRHSGTWQATITPLASIMGSGFLVCAPLLAANVGNAAIFAMATLLLLAYGVGEAVRFNIRYAEPLLEARSERRSPPASDGGSHAVVRLLELLARLVLAVAYFISVTYYLQLLAAFLLKGFNIQNHLIANLMTTALLVVIGGIGWWRGLSRLESIEKYIVSLNLSMIGALLVGLLFYNAKLLTQGSWQLSTLAPTESLRTIQVLLGLLIVVQGFEISRFLGDEYPAEQRIKTMRYAQLISTAVYLIFIALITILFEAHGDKGVTAIIDMSATVASFLPPLLIIAAAGSQFSASVADFSGAEGLITEISRSKISPRHTFLLITAVTISLAWLTDVIGVISLASRAFALFYSLQCMVAFAIARQKKDLSFQTGKLTLFGSLAVICLLVTLFGIPAG